ncbi:MAG: stage III sporulation protein AB [Oscillospiraceae bacterium]|nr:stage III sporulation protein AB [Oscillospiraceae bacterium]
MPKRFEQAIKALPPGIRSAAMELPETVRAHAEEIRLRAGQAVTVVSETSRELSVSASARDLQQTLENVSQGSLHTVLDNLRHGFLPLPGGHRMGLCGTAVMKDGQVTLFRELSSLCIRVARERKGIAEKLMPQLLVRGQLAHTLILSPPGVGKTTLLRDLIRVVSNGNACLPPARVSAADERGELAASIGGTPQLDVGRNTDVMTGVPKADAAVMLLRGMSPQVLAMDEITAPEDTGVIASCLGCGVTVLSTAHAAGIQDMIIRPVYRGLLGYFERVVVISGTGASRKYEIQEVKAP